MTPMRGTNVITVGGPPAVPGGIVVKPVVLPIEVRVTGGVVVTNVTTVGVPPEGPGEIVVRPVELPVEVTVIGAGGVTNVTIVIEMGSSPSPIK